MLCKKKHIEKSNTYRKYNKKNKGEKLNIEYEFFFCKMLLIHFKTYINYDYWDLITKFWPGSTKWNIPFILIDFEFLM